MQSEQDLQTGEETFIIVKIAVKEGHQAEFNEMMKELVTETRKEPGSVRYVLVKVDDEPHHYYLYEDYKSPAAFETHVQSDHYKRLAPLLTNIVDYTLTKTRLVL